MADLSVALPYTIRNEGGYTFTDTPGDAGGQTFAGCTIKTVSTYLGRQATTAEMKSLSPATVEAIYRKMYWNVIQGDAITQQLVATCLFDMSVLMGPVRAVMIAQSVVGQKTDGSVGPKTLAALSKVGAVAFVNAFSDMCDSFFEQVVAKNPTQQKFLAGWEKRTSEMDHIAQV